MLFSLETTTKQAFHPTSCLVIVLFRKSMTATMSLNTQSLVEAVKFHIKDLIVSPMIHQVLQNIPPIETFGHYGKYANCPKMEQNPMSFS